MKSPGGFFLKVFEPIPCRSRTWRLRFSRGHIRFRWGTDMTGPTMLSLRRRKQCFRFCFCFSGDWGEVESSCAFFGFSHCFARGNVQSVRFRESLIFSRSLKDERFFVDYFLFLIWRVFERKMEKLFCLFFWL